MLLQFCWWWLELVEIEVRKQTSAVNQSCQMYFKRWDQVKIKLTKCKSNPCFGLNLLEIVSFVHLAVSLCACSIKWQKNTRHLYVCTVFKFSSVYFIYIEKNKYYPLKQNRINHSFFFVFFFCSFRPTRRAWMTWQDVFHHGGRRRWGAERQRGAWRVSRLVQLTRVNFTICRCVSSQKCCCALVSRADVQSKPSDRTCFVRTSVSG